MVTFTLGQFVLETARSEQKNRYIPEQQAKEVRDHLSERVNEKLEVLRAAQRQAYDNSKSVTVF